MNAIPVTHAGSDRPDRKKSADVVTRRFNAKPMPITKAK